MAIVEEPEVRVHDDVQIRASLRFNVTFLDTSKAEHEDLRTRFKEQLELTSDILLKGIITNSILEAASIWDDNVNPPGLDNLICHDLPAATHEFLERQNAILRSYGIHPTDDGVLHYRTPRESIFINIEHIEHFHGSFLSKNTIRIVVSEGKSIAGHVIAGLFVVIISSAIISHPDGDGNNDPVLITAEQKPLYICFLDTVILGNAESIYENAAVDLLMLKHYSNEEKKLVIRSRQACLKAAGFDPGPIDGIDGPLTEGAAEAFSYYHGGIVINWNSVIFLRFLVQSATKRQSKLRR